LNELNEKINKYLIAERKNITEDIQTLCRIPSVRSEPEEGAPYGRICRNIMDVGASLARTHGLQAEIYSDGRYVLATSGEGTHCIGFFTHLDIVAANGMWTYPPFEPTEVDGYLIGRGVSDNKNGVVAAMYAIKAVRDLNLPIQSKLLLFMGGAEETGMQDIEAYVNEQLEQPDFSIVADSMFPVCKGERGTMDIHVTCDTPFEDMLSMDGEAFQSVSCRVADRAKACLKYTDARWEILRSDAANSKWIETERINDSILVHAHGIAKHASEPEGSINAVQKLVNALLLCTDLPINDCQILSTASTFLRDPYGTGFGIAQEEPELGRLRCINRGVELKDGRPILWFSCHYGTQITGEMIGECIKLAAADSGWFTEYEKINEGYNMTSTDSRISALTNIYGQVSGHSKGIDPIILGGGTYARKLRNAVGFGPTFPDPVVLPYKDQALHGTAHQPDEALPIESYLQAIKIYILSIVKIDELSRGD
jgi:succinyl-diaminopimelate desuccinylase